MKRVSERENNTNWKFFFSIIFMLFFATNSGGCVHYPSSMCAYMDHSIYTWINQTERIKSFISVHSTYSKATLNIIWQTINVWYPNLAESIAWTWLKQKCSTYIYILEKGNKKKENRETSKTWNTILKITENAMLLNEKRFSSFIDFTYIDFYFFAGTFPRLVSMVWMKW